MQRFPPTLRKAAILVASLDRHTADALLEQMPAEQAARVRECIIQLEDIEAEEEQAVLEEFVRVRPLAPSQPLARSQQGAGIELDAGLARRLARRSELAQRTELAQKSAPPADREPEAISTDDAELRKLVEMAGPRLVSLLQGEHPQTIALVVSHLPPGRAAAVVGGLQADLQAEVLRRLVERDDAHPDALRDVARGLESRVSRQDQSERRRAEGVAAVAAILEAADPRLRRDLLENLTQYDRELASHFGSARFDFADLERADDATLVAVLGAAEPEVAVLALAGASPGLVHRLYALLPAAEAKRLRKAIEHVGPLRLRDVEAAQRSLADLALELSHAGRVTLPAGGMPLLTAA